MKSKKAQVRAQANTYERTVQVVASVISLVALLVYTFVHSGGLLSHYVQPWFVGYIAALGIEIAVVSLALRIGDLRDKERSTGVLWFVLGSVMVVSAFANTSEGFQTLQGEALSLETFQHLDIVETVVGLSATALISLIVLALSDIIGGEVRVVVQDTVQGQKEKSGEGSNSTGSDTFGRVRDMATGQARQSKSDALDTLVEILDSEPDASVSELKVRIGRSRTTTYAYLQELKKEGRI